MTETALIAQLKRFRLVDLVDRFERHDRSLNADDFYVKLTDVEALLAERPPATERTALRPQIHQHEILRQMRLDAILKAAREPHAMTERFPQEYDPRGFKAKCIGCGKPLCIPWETMCDAGYCDACMKKKPKRSPTP